MALKQVLHEETYKWFGLPSTKTTLRFLDKQRRSGEAWICVELALHLMSSIPGLTIQLEAKYPLDSRRRCDLLLMQGDEKVWVEVAHIWSWHQSKGREKCERDVKRLTAKLGKGNGSGVLLLFLISRPTWLSDSFEGWLKVEQQSGRVLVIN